MNAIMETTTSSEPRRRLNLDAWSLLQGSAKGESILSTEPEASRVLRMSPVSRVRVEPSYADLYSLRQTGPLARSAETVMLVAQFASALPEHFDWSSPIFRTFISPSNTAGLIYSDVSLGRWNRAMHDLRKAMESWEEDDGVQPEEASIRLLQQMIPVLQHRTRMPNIDLQDDGSIALRWRLPDPVRSACIKITPSRIAAIIADNGPDGGFAESISTPEAIFQARDQIRIERWIEKIIENPRFLALAR